MFLKCLVRVSVLALICVSVASASALDQKDPIKDEWRSAVSRSITHTSRDEAAKLVDRALSATQKWFQSQNVSFQRVKLDGSSFDSFQILPNSNGHRLNQQAARVARGLSVILVYSPSYLMRGAEGFFSDQDQALGISNKMIEQDGEFDSTFYHEVIHAAHFRSRMKGQVDPLSAVFQVVSSDIDARISEVQSGYRRLQTLEEIEAHVESLVRLNQELSAAKNGGALNSLVELVLNSMHHSANEGELLARQSHQAILLTLESPSWLQKSSTATREIFFPASAYEVGARYRKIENGAKTAWRLKAPVSDAELKRKLGEADQLAVMIASEFKAVRQSMHYLIERVDAGRTDAKKVNQAVDRLQSTFDRWKQNYSAVVIPRF